MEDLAATGALREQGSSLVARGKRASTTMVSIRHLPVHASLVVRGSGGPDLAGGLREVDCGVPPLPRSRGGLLEG